MVEPCGGAKKYILAVDEGTTGVRSLLFDESLKVVSHSYRKIESLHPGIAMVEQDPVAVVQRTAQSMREAVITSGIPARDIACACLTTQRGTWLLYDRQTGMPYTNLIIWQDTRGSFEKELLLGNEEFCSRFPKSAAQMHDLGNHLCLSIHRVIRLDDDLQQLLRTRQVAWGHMDTWLIYNLCREKQHVISRNIAGTDLYLDFYRADTGRFNEELLPFIYLHSDNMPRVLYTTDDYGTLDPEILGVPIPVVSVSADQQAALFAQGCHEAGMAKCTMGTGTFVDVNVGARHTVIEGLNSMVAWDFPGEQRFQVEGSSVTSGACLEWAKNNMQLFDSFAQADEMAESVPDAAGVCFVPAIMGMNNVPFNNVRGRGSFMGLEASADRRHFVRAIMQGIAFAAVCIFETASQSIGSMSRIIIDGGVTRSDLICRILCDLTGATVSRPKLLEASALGVAEMAAIHLGWITKQDVPGLLEPGTIFVPSASTYSLRQQYQLWKRAVERSKDWLEF